MKSLIFLLISVSLFAQTAKWGGGPKLLIDSSEISYRLDSIHVSHLNEFKKSQCIIPGILIGYGFLATETDLFKKVNFDTRNEIVEDHPTFATGIDNYSQFAPAATVFTLQALGVKGENSIRKEAIVYAMSLGITTTIVVPTKVLTHQLRPDGSNYHSFPSGHTATSFASAEFLRREYWHTSPWIGIAGYAVASGTGILRMYNNKHWLGDVAAGAGIGILSTTLSYWLYDTLKLDKKNAVHHAMIYPTYNEKRLGVGLLKQF